MCVCVCLPDHIDNRVCQLRPSGGLCCSQGPRCQRVRLHRSGISCLLAIVHVLQPSNLSALHSCSLSLQVRYGHIFRGNKVENAQAAGAVGVIIYSDPADDGFARGPVYPTV